MNVPNWLLDRAFLSWAFGGLAAVAAGAWKVFTYFDKRKLADHDRAAEQTPPGDSLGVPPEQVVAMLRVLLHQAQRQAPRTEAPASNASRSIAHAVDPQVIGRFLSLVLRHNPSAAAIQLDPNGWADVDALLTGVNAAGYHVTLQDLETVVQNSLGKRDEHRFSLSPDKRRIRANWGHSIEMRGPRRTGQ